eukprot:c916_g1_i1 orf=2-607(-)
MADEKMCFCWQGSLVDCCVRRCKDDVVVDVSTGVRPVVPHTPVYSERNPGFQRMLSDIGNRGSDASDLELVEVLRQRSSVRAFTYNELKAATRNFRPDGALGEGGFGVVYKGWIDEIGPTGLKVASGVTVAVKVLNRGGLQGHREWLAEVNFLGQLQHPHLVKLLGYCCEDEHRLIVYEFMPRGSLENHLFRQSTLPLSWAT